MTRKPLNFDDITGLWLDNFEVVANADGIVWLNCIRCIGFVATAGQWEGNPPLYDVIAAGLDHDAAEHGENHEPEPIYDPDLTDEQRDAFVAGCEEAGR